VLFLDIDGFKRLNDTAGHAAGDAVLRRASARVRGALRPTESAVRWGGDEIVVVCRDVHDDAALQAVGSRLLTTLREPFSLDGVGRVRVGVSMGAARSWPGARAEELVEPPTRRCTAPSAPAATAARWPRLVRAAPSGCPRRRASTARASRD
jgi:diguanylate cyclase (GGDEF)-like protein